MDSAVLSQLITTTFSGTFYSVGYDRQVTPSHFSSGVACVALGGTVGNTSMHEEPGMGEQREGAAGQIKQAILYLGNLQAVSESK